MFSFNFVEVMDNISKDQTEPEEPVPTVEVELTEEESIAIVNK